MSASLPKIEMEPISGSGSDFKGFRNSFGMQIASQIPDSSQELSYLIFCCRGPAEEAINYCSLLSCDQGYSMV